ncbi:hypothetical protein [Miltoncostaea marina]|uniref:hypothetical protein n=1 Tax=Miltoncostaea marina TaxID=2843215 RepID=UPI001C3E4EFF|nr:hypothetical protein [Miltoncostaea marina]
MSDVAPLTAASRAALPAPCVDCVFWQHDRLVTDARRKGAWIEAVERRNGGFGRVLREGPEVRGMVQYGPVAAFPRALALPAGPPGRDAALITCSFIDCDEPRGACERLLLDALADLKARGWAAVDAFAVEHGGDADEVERFGGHHTLFDRELLEALGFTDARAAGPVVLMRLDLRALVPGPGLVERAARRAARLLPGPQPSGAPA